MEKCLREVAKILNRSFRCTPILYGSFAVEKVVKKKVDAHDVDVLIDHRILEKKRELMGVFEEAGFHHLHDDPLAFGKNGIEVELADREKWFGMCMFSPEGLLVRKGFGFRFKLLDAGNLEKLYRFLINDPLRPEHKKRKDEILIGLLKKTKR